MGTTAETLSKNPEDGVTSRLSWSDFVEDTLPCSDFWISYSGREFMVQTLDQKWCIVDSTKLDRNGCYPILFEGPTDMMKFTETPVPLFGGRSLREAWPDIVFVSA
jgi:hypothetical protein